MTKILLNSRGFVIEVTFFHTNIFLKSVVTPSKILSVINFYIKALKRFAEQYFRGYRGFGFYCLNCFLSIFWKYLKQEI